MARPEPRPEMNGCAFHFPDQDRVDGHGCGESGETAGWHEMESRSAPTADRPRIRSRTRSETKPCVPHQDAIPKRRQRNEWPFDPEADCTLFDKLDPDLGQIERGEQHEQQKKGLEQVGA